MQKNQGIESENVPIVREMVMTRADLCTCCVKEGSMFLLLEACVSRL